MTDNPLLIPFDTIHQTAPFHLIREEHYLPAFKEAMKQGKNEIAAIISNNDHPSFSNTVEALEKSGQLLGTISSIFFNLNHAETNETIQEIAREVSPLLTEYSNDIWLNPELFEKVKIVFNSDEKNTLSAEQQKLLEDTHKAFVRKGALLKGVAKERYREITKELSTLTLQFGENVLAETNAFKLHITDRKALTGLPDGALAAASALAKSEEKEGWLFSLQFPSYFPFMKYADNRELRQQMYMAHASRGNNNNERDNKTIIQKIVNLRVEKAKLMGFDTHANFVLEEHMALKPDTVHKFLHELLEASIDFAREDVKEVSKFANQEGLKEELQRWDYLYYSEKLKTTKFGLNDEMTKPYFQLENVENGIFSLAQKLYGLSFKINNKIEGYHSEAKAYEVFDEDGTFLSVLYVDYHPRATKQGGAWMTSFRDQHLENGDDIRPHISIVCNFTRPTEQQPSLLTFMEVTTFLHEFGHALHGMLSKVTYESLAGTSVYRDFVELPSQIMENWATQREWLQEVGVHYKTGEVIPEELIQKLIDSDNFQSGYAMVRQLSFGLNDMAWHTLSAPFDGDVIEFEKKAIEKTELFRPIENLAVSTAFSHIFDGGYASGYYGYKWAEVLDADAFDAFLENGIYNRETAQKFRREILEKGGTRHPMELYKAFRGKEPSIEPLLKRSGLVK